MHVFIDKCYATLSMRLHPAFQRSIFTHEQINDNSRLSIDSLSGIYLQATRTILTKYALSMLSNYLEVHSVSNPLQAKRLHSI